MSFSDVALASGDGESGQLLLQLSSFFLPQDLFFWHTKPHLRLKLWLHNFFLFSLLNFALLFST